MKYLLLALLLFSSTLSAFPQSFIGKSPKKRPSSFDKPKFSTQVTNTKPGRDLWAVWADREGVVSSNGKQLEFAHRFLVVEESSDKIHIVEEGSSYNSATDEFISEPVDFGWVPKATMLLWATALYSDVTSFRMKGMTITTPDHMKLELERIHKTNGKKLNFYSNPTTTKENNNELPLFEIFYIFKKEGSRILLARRDNISKGNASYYIMGWVDQDKVQIWDKRQVVEPDWDKGASEERKQNKVPSALFQTSKEATTYGKTGDTTNNYWASDRYDNRYEPMWKRLPIFDMKDNIIETAVVSDLVNETGKQIKEGDMRILQVRQSELTERRRNINVVFVIDGTESMGPYFKSVQDAVKTSTRNLYNSNNNLMFGAVVYRDYDKPENDMCYNVIPIGSNVERFCQEMETYSKLDPKCFDQTASEGLYLGINKARSLFRGKEKESNVIILIGDAADRKGPGRVTQEDVIPDLVKNRINFTAIQVNHKAGQTYEDFVTEIPAMVLKESEQLVTEQEKVYCNNDLIASEARPRWLQETKQDVGFFTLQNGPLVGGLQYMSAGKSLAPERTSKIIEKMITDMNSRTDSLLKMVNNLISSITTIDPTKAGSFSPAVKLMLKDAGFTSEQISILTQKNYQFLLKTYTSYKVQKLKYPVYKFDIFLDSEELTDMITTLTNILSPDLTSYKRRQNFKDAWYEILRANYGVSREDIKNKSFSELMKLISGLPSPNPILEKFTCDDITDITRLPDKEFDMIVKNIQNQTELLTKIRGDKKFYFLSNDRAFYWIPQNYLP
jgi:hypothetical protein